MIFMNKKIKMLLLLLLVGWSVGLSLRFLVEYFINGHNLYNIVLFDMLFDWLGMFLLGIANLGVFLHEFYIEVKR
jgi:hypothetical protein